MTVVIGLILRSLLFAAVAVVSGEKLPVADVERHVHELINAERAKARLQTLKLDEKLSAIARAHSQDMAERGFFSHINPEGKNPTARGEAADYTCRVVEARYVRVGLAENIYGTKAYRPVLHRPGPLPYYEMKTVEEVAIAAVHAWVESPGHRENLLRSVFTKTGVGVAISADDRVLITQMFC